MFSVRLKELREKAGYSQYSFADAFNISQSTIGNWEAGTREPKFATMIRLADFFNVSVDYLLGRTDEMNPSHKISNSDNKELDQKFLKLLSDIESLPPSQQEKFMNMMASTLALLHDQEETGSN